MHDLGLPHPVHVHCNNLGVPGNWRTTLDTLDTLEGRRAHLAHLQFHAYGGKPGGRPRVAGAGARRVPRRAPGAERRRRAGDVRPGDDDDRRRAGLRRPARDHPRPLGQRRHRGRDRLRDRPVHLPRAQLRARAAVGDRPRAVPAQPRPVAARAVHRPPQRRLVPQLPAPDPPADGPRVPQRADPAGQQEGDAAHRPARRPRSRVHAGGDRDHHARRAGAPARAARQGPPRRRRRRRHHDLRRPRRPRGDVRRAAPRHQGRALGRRGRRAARGGRGPPAAGRRGVRPEHRGHAGEAVRGPLQRAVRELSRARAVAARARAAPSPRSRDEAARSRDRRHVRRGVPDVGRARRDHRGDAGVGARGGALDDRLRHVGDRLQVRGGHRARARSRRDARRAAGRQRAAVRDGPGGRGQAAGRARRAVRADVADGGLLQRPGGRGHGRRRRPAALLRRRLPGQQGARRASATGACR